MKELRDGSDLILRSIEFQIVGAANWKALRPMAVVVKGTCKRLSEEERRALLVGFKLMRDDMYEGVKHRNVSLIMKRPSISSSLLYALPSVFF